MAASNRVMIDGLPRHGKAKRPESIGPQGPTRANTAVLYQLGSTDCRLIDGNLDLKLEFVQFFGTTGG